MLYKIGICDDDKYFIERLENALKRYSLLNSLSFEIFSYLSGEELMNDYHNHYFNFLILDMEMGEVNGIEVAKRLRDAGDNISITYTTVHEDFALQAYQVNADYYIIKPFTEALLFAVLGRILRRLALESTWLELHRSFLSLKVKGDIIQLAYDDITYISKLRNSLIFHTPTREYAVYMNIKDILGKLDTSIFVKINQGQIVNWPKITSFKDGIITITGVELPVSRSHRSRLSKRYRYELEQFLRKKEHLAFSNIELSGSPTK